MEFTPICFTSGKSNCSRGATETFSGDHSRTGKGKEVTQVKKLEQTVAKKDEVISWLTEENNKLKKTFGDL